MCIVNNQLDFIGTAVTFRIMIFTLHCITITLRSRDFSGLTKLLALLHVAVLSRCCSVFISSGNLVSCRDTVWGRVRSKQAGSFVVLCNAHVLSAG